MQADQQFLVECIERCFRSAARSVAKADDVRYDRCHQLEIVGSGDEPGEPESPLDAVASISAA